MTKEKKCLMAISFLMQIVFIFFEIFFSVYAYDISKDLNIIILYTIISNLASCLFKLAIYKFISKKLLIIFYRLSFFISLIVIGLTFTISESTIYMIFITQIMLKITHVFYYMPHEVATMNVNKTSHMKKFLGLSSFLSLIAGFLSPFLSGIIIDYYSYYIIFSILLVLSIIAFILSFWVTPIKEEAPRYGLIKFIKESHKIKHVRYGYTAHMFYKISSDGIVASFLPILIFLKTGTNFSVGLYSAIASLLTGVILLIYCYFNKNKKLAMWLCTIFQISVSICIIFWNSIVVFFVYYFIKKITSKILGNGTNENTFTLINNTSLENCKIENFYTYNLYNIIGIIFACLISLLVYNLSNNVITITILLGAFSITQIVSTLFLTKSESLRNNTNPQNLNNET